MAQVLKINSNGSFADADIKWSVPSGHDTVYLSYEIFIPSATGDVFNGINPWTIDFFGEIGFGSSFGTNDLYLNSDDGLTFNAIKDDFFPTETVGLAYDAWHTVGWSLVAPGTNLHQRIDSTDDSHLYSSFPRGDITYIKVGLLGSAAGASGDVPIYVRAITLGTTPWTSDLLSYDPDTDGDPSTFGFTIETTSPGSVTLVEEPTPVSDYTPEPADPPSTLAGLSSAYFLIDHMNLPGLDVIQTFRPENLQFKFNDGREPSTVAYEISFSAKDIDGVDIVTLPTGPEWVPFIGPWRHGFRLRYVSQTDTSLSKVIMAGPITSLSTTEGDDFMSVGGKDWFEVLNRTMLPWKSGPTIADMREFVFLPDAGTVTDNDPPVGVLYWSEGDRQIQKILHDIWTHVFTSVPHRLPMIWGGFQDGTELMKYRLDFGDTRTLLEIVQDFLDVYPGRYAIIGPGRTFTVVGPLDTHDLNIGPGHTAYHIDVDTNGVASVTFENTGPEWTHLTAEGAGLSNTLVRTLGDSANETTFSRIDGTINLGNVVNQTHLNAMTQNEFVRGVQPQHQITVSLDLNTFQDSDLEFFADNGTFWNVFLPNNVIWLTRDLVYHRIDSPQRIVSINVTVGNENNTTVELELNQVYDLTSHGGDVEG